MQAFWGAFTSESQAWHVSCITKLLVSPQNTAIQELSLYQFAQEIKITDVNKLKVYPAQTAAQSVPLWISSMLKHSMPMMCALAPAVVCGLHTVCLMRDS